MERVTTCISYILPDLPGHAYPSKVLALCESEMKITPMVLLPGRARRCENIEAGTQLGTRLYIFVCSLRRYGVGIGAGISPSEVGTGSGNGSGKGSGGTSDSSSTYELQLGKNVLATILAVWPRVTLLPGRKYGRFCASHGSNGPPQGYPFMMPCRVSRLIQV